MSGEFTSRKRSRTSSYTQSVKEGDAPRAYSLAFEKVLWEHGLHMEEMKDRALVSESSKRLCKQLLQAQHEAPRYTPYPSSEFLSVWDRVRTRNECKIIQDLTPLLVPSSEHLYASGHQDIEHVREELSVEWTRSKTLGGPRPKPDRAIGLGDLAFAEEEKAKLKNHTSFERPTLFTDHLYFPCPLCEVKCGIEGLDRAYRQNMHSASIATDAIVQICRAGGTDEDGGWKRAYDFTLELCHTFYPQHINRIQGALAEMVEPWETPSSSVLDLVESESFGVAESAGSSQETNVFRVPLAPASRRQKEELAFLREQLNKQEQQMAKQEQQCKEQMAKQERQIAKQEQQHKEQMEMLQRLLDQQKA